MKIWTNQNGEWKINIFIMIWLDQTHSSIKKKKKKKKKTILFFVLVVYSRFCFSFEGWVFDSDDEMFDSFCFAVEAVWRWRKKNLLMEMKMMEKKEVWVLLIQNCFAPHTSKLLLGVQLCRETTWESCGTAASETSRCRCACSPASLCEAVQQHACTSASLFGRGQRVRQLLLPCAKGRSRCRWCRGWWKRVLRMGRIFVAQNSFARCTVGACLHIEWPKRRSCRASKWHSWRSVAVCRLECRRSSASPSSAWGL